MRGPGFHALLLICIVTMSAPALAGRDPRLGLSVEISSNDLGGMFTPANLTLENSGKPRQVELRISQEGYTGGASVTRLALGLQPGTTEIELPLLNRERYNDISVQTIVDGGFAPDLAAQTFSSGLSTGAMKAVILGKSLSELEGRLDEISPTVLFPRRAPRHWQLYLGRRLVVFTTPKVVGELEAEQKRALAHWVEYGGGILWILGDGAKRATHALGLPLGTTISDGVLTEKGVTLNAEWRRCISGSVVLSPLERISMIDKDILDALHDQRRGLSDVFADYDRLDRAISPDLFDDLHEVPRLGFSLLSLLLGLLIGPVNLVLLRRRKKLVFFYLTAPVGAIAGMFALGIFSFVSEGFDLRINDYAVLLHDMDRNEGTLYRTRGIFGSFTPSQITLSRSTAAIPLSSYGTRELRSYDTDWTAAQILRSGWIRSRDHSGLFTAEPGRVRIGLRPVVRGPEDVWIQSELSGTARDVVVRLPTDDGGHRFYTADEVRPGDLVGMARDSHRTNAVIPLVELDRLDWTVVARTDWLPRLENGAVDGKVLERGYYYVGVRAPRPAAAAGIPESPRDTAGDGEEAGDE